MPKQAEAKFRKLDFHQQRRIDDTIRDHAEIDSGARTVRYHDGWDDERVASEAVPEVAPEVRVRQVQGFRLRTHGKVLTGLPPAPPVDYGPDIEAMKRWIVEVSNTLGIAAPAFAATVRFPEVEAA